MLQRDAFVLLARRVWCMLDDNAPIDPAVTKLFETLELTPFRESVARMVLDDLTRTMRRTYTPEAGARGADFIHAVAFAIAASAEDDRPPAYEEYTPKGFAEAMIATICNGYRELAAWAHTDEELASCTVHCTVPNLAAADELRKRIRALDITSFGTYRFPTRKQHPQTHPSLR